MTWQRACRLGLIALATAFVVTQIAALFTDGANWDELALLRRAADTLQTGTLKGGGRPGLSVLMLLPFVDGCSHVMHVVVASRVLGCAITLASVAGLFVMLRLVTRRSTCSLHSAALATAAYALVPLFLRWSLQVRTDQLAVAASVWAGAAVLTSRARWWVVAGGLFTVGYLSSQKALYIVALVGVIALGDLYIEAKLDWRRELKRLVAVAAGALVVYAAFHGIVRIFFAPARVMSVDEGMNLFRWYRVILAFRLYRDILPTVLPHIGLILLVIAAALRSFRRGTAERRPLLVALVVLLLGWEVGRFHTASFPYFWLTIGLFPACAIALGWSGIRELLPRLHVAVAALAWAAMIVLAIDYRAQTLRDTQQIQRDTLQFAEALPPSLRGFNADGALMCRKDPDPFPVFLGQHVQERFFGPKGAAYTDQFLAEHRTRPVAFLVRTNRVTFPPDVQAFWTSHYVRYHDAVWLAGFEIKGASGTRADLDVLVPGRYRWLTVYGARVSVEGHALASGDTIELAPGTHHAELAGAAGDGMLVYVVDAPPRRDPTPFYDPAPIAELSGVRRHWW